MLWICHEPSAFIQSNRWIYALQPVWKSKVARLLHPFLAYGDKRLAGHGDAIIANSRFAAEQVRVVYGRQVAGIACPGVDSRTSELCRRRRAADFSWDLTADSVISVCEKIFADSNAFPSRNRKKTGVKDGR